MDNHGPSHNGVLPREAQERVGDVNLGSSSRGLHIAQVSSVPGTFWVGGSSMLTTIKVEVGTSTGASIGVVSKLMHMEAMEAVSQSSQLPSHLDRPTEDDY